MPRPHGLVPTPNAIEPGLLGAPFGEAERCNNAPAGRTRVRGPVGRAGPRGARSGVADRQKGSSPPALDRRGEGQPGRRVLGARSAPESSSRAAQARPPTHEGPHRARWAALNLAVGLRRRGFSRRSPGRASGVWVSVRCGVGYIGAVWSMRVRNVEPPAAARRLSETSEADAYDRTVPVQKDDTGHSIPSAEEPLCPPCPLHCRPEADDSPPVQAKIRFKNPNTSRRRPHPFMVSTRMHAGLECTRRWRFEPTPIGARPPLSAPQSPLDFALFFGAVESECAPIGARSCAALALGPGTLEVVVSAYG